MICWARLPFIGLVMGSAHPSLARLSPRELAQEGSSSSRPSQPSNQVVIDGVVVGPKVRAEPGEICIVCNNPVGPDDPVYLVQGQRVPVHADEEREFLSNPRKYLMRLKPMGGALLGADSNEPGMANRAGNDQPSVSRVWIYGGLYVLLGLVFAALCAHRALHVGYSPWARPRSQCIRLPSPADPAQARGPCARRCTGGLGQDRGYPCTRAVPKMRRI